MTEKYEIPTGASRPRYFDNELLLDDDFIFESGYHIAHMRRHERLLHVSGITEGLELGAGEGFVSVNLGSAIDSKGRAIVVVAWTKVLVEVSNGTWSIVIGFGEVEGEFLNLSEKTGAKRFVQSAKIVLTNPNEVDPNDVVLGNVTYSNGVPKLDQSTRRYSGVRFPGSNVTLRRLGTAEVVDSAVTLKGTLNVTGVLSAGSIAGTTGALQITCGLNVTGTAMVEGKATLSGGAAVTGALLAGTFDVTGAAALKGGATVTGALLAGSLDVTGAAALKGGATVTGALSAGSLDVTGAAALKGGATVTGALSAGSFSVYGATFLNSAHISDNATFTKNATIDQKLTVKTVYAESLNVDTIARNTNNHDLQFDCGFSVGSAQYPQGITVNGAAKIVGLVMVGSLSSAVGGSLQVTSGLTIGSGSGSEKRDLVVNGAATVTGPATMALVTSTGLTVNGAAKVTGPATMGAVTATGLTVNGAATITGALSVASLTMVGGLTVGSDVTSGTIAALGKNIEVLRGGVIKDTVKRNPDYVVLRHWAGEEKIGDETPTYEWHLYVNAEGKLVCRGRKYGSAGGKYFLTEGLEKPLASLP